MGFQKTYLLKKRTKMKTILKVENIDVEEVKEKLEELGFTVK